MSALSRELGVSLSSLTQIADRLERARLVKRTAAEGDRRVRCLQLTARGAAMMRKRRDARLRHSLAVLEHLSSTERQLVRAAMETLVTACGRARRRRNHSHRRRLKQRRTSLQRKRNRQIEWQRPLRRSQFDQWRFKTAEPSTHYKSTTCAAGNPNRGQPYERSC